MPTPVQLGAVRGIAFARISSPLSKFFFLDEGTGGEKAAQFGRSLRLGDPINTGVNSNWQQLTWVGGAGQTVWRDVEMYDTATCDVQSLTGKLQMWPGWAGLAKWHNTNWVEGLIMTQGSGTGFLYNGTPLYVGETDYWDRATVGPMYSVYRCTKPYLQAGEIVWVGSFNTPIRSMASFRSDTHAENWIALTTSDKFYLIQESSRTVVEDTAAAGAVSGQFWWNSLVSFSDAIYYLRGDSLMKRIPAPPFGVNGTHTVVSSVVPSSQLRSLVVWNNRLWYGVMYPDGTSAIYVSDGATSTKAFDFPTEFGIIKMTACNGALYILGIRQGNPDSNTVQQQVWRYDGSRLKMIWQEGTPYDSSWHGPTDITTNGNNVVWGMNALPGLNTRARLMYYDTEVDAIIDGPGLNMHAANDRGLTINAIAPWNNTLVASFRNHTVTEGFAFPGAILFLRPPYVRNDFTWPWPGTQEFDQANDPTTYTQILRSSEYHGTDDVAAERKTWLGMRLRYKFTGLNSSIVVKAVVDGVTYTLGNIFAADTSWHTQTFAVKNVAGVYIQSEVIQYYLELRNSDVGVPTSTAMPIIDTVSTTWKLAPIKRRQWQLRIPVTDAQALLDGTPNALVTATALADTLEDFYYEQLPILMWGPNQDGSATGNGTEVSIIDYQRTIVRLASDETGTLGTVLLTVVENTI